jgi:hypothetical protein
MNDGGRREQQGMKERKGKWEVRMRGGEKGGGKFGMRC